MVEKFEAFFQMRVDPDLLLAFDDVWRGSRTPRCQSRTAALRLLMVAVVDSGRLDLVAPSAVQVELAQLGVDSDKTAPP